MRLLWRQGGTGGVGNRYTSAPYKLHGEAHFANATELQLPAGIASVVLNVRGLNDFPLKPSYESGRCRTTRWILHNGITNFLTPMDWATFTT